MKISKSNRSLIFLLVALISMISTNIQIAHAQTKIEIIFTRTPAEYNNQTGYFILGQELTDDSGTGRVCISFDYFVFNAQAGQVLQGTLQPGNAGKVIYYAILNSPNQLLFFQTCGAGNSGQIQGLRALTSQTTLSWVAPKSGWYGLVFFVNGFYDSPVYFVQ